MCMRKGHHPRYEASYQRSAANPWALPHEKKHFFFNSHFLYQLKAAITCMLQEVDGTVMLQMK